MRRLCALVALVIATLFSTASAQTVPQVPPPTLVAPMLTVGVPILFEWLPVNPGNLYNFTLQQHTRAPRANSPFIIYYELQISDHPDVTSHVLVDVTTSTTLFLFQNQNVAGSGFTSAQRQGLPLAAGLYYWRVRALVDTVATPFSQIGSFTLNLGVGGGASTPFHDLSITSLVLTAPAFVGTSSVIIATVQNTGTFPEQGSPITITANGVEVARVKTPPMGAGETSRITAIWTPTRRGLSQITSVLNFVGPNPDGKFATISRTVADQPQFATAIRGTLISTPAGFALIDTKTGRQIALVFAASGGSPDLASLVGHAVVIRGTLTKRQTTLILLANQAATAPQ